MRNKAKQIISNARYNKSEKEKEIGDLLIWGEDF